MECLKWVWLIMTNNCFKKQCLTDLQLSNIKQWEKIILIIYMENWHFKPFHEQSKEQKNAPMKNQIWIYKSPLLKNPNRNYKTQIWWYSKAIWKRLLQLWVKWIFDFHKVFIVFFYTDRIIVWVDHIYIFSHKCPSFIFPLEEI